MNKKVVSVCLSLLLLFSLVFVLQVSGNSVSSVTETAGVVNCIISFTCSDPTDSIVIYYDTSPGITTGDSSTYTDPSGCNYGNRADRKMLITGLTESTTYYYRIYAVGEGWADSEGSFSTLDRFTTEYKDEFYDNYLVEASSNMNVVQQVGTKHGSAFITDDGMGVGYLTMIKDGGTYRIILHDYTDRDYFQLYTSNDGTTWADQGRWTVTGEPGPPDNDRRFGGWTNDSENNQWVVTYVIDEKDGYIATSATADGTYASTKVLEADNNPNSQCYLLNAGIDSLGANKWFDIGKFRLATGDTNRYVGYSWGFTDTDWMSVHTRQDTAGNYERIDSQQCYANGVIIDSGCYIDFNHPYGEGGTEEIRCFLMCSRDGIDFNAVDSTTEIIPLGSDGSWDDEMLFAAWQAGIFHEGNYDYVYYSAWDGDHAASGRVSAVSRIRFRHDGLTAYEPSSASAWFRTDAIKGNFTANFTVNGDFDVSNTLKIAVLDATTSIPYSGFDTGDFTTINTDSLSHSPSWGSNTLDDIPAGDFKLKFTFTGSNGILYAYEMDYGEGGNGSSIISLQSINSLANNSVLQDDNRTFVWNIVSDTTSYSLRVSNYSDFHDEIFLQLDNISLAEWGAGYYSEADGNVTFVLPDQYNITAYDYHYYQVRAYTT